VRKWRGRGPHKGRIHPDKERRDVCATRDVKRKLLMELAQIAAACGLRLSVCARGHDSTAYRTAGRRGRCGHQPRRSRPGLRASLRLCGFARGVLIFSQGPSRGWGKSPRKPSQPRLGRHLGKRGSSVPTPKPDVAPVGAQGRLEVLVVPRLHRGLQDCARVAGIPPLSDIWSRLVARYPPILPFLLDNRLDVW